MPSAWWPLTGRGRASPPWPCRALVHRWPVGTFARPTSANRERAKRVPGDCPVRGKGAGTPPDKERAGEGSFATHRSDDRSGFFAWVARLRRAPRNLSPSAGAIKAIAERNMQQLLKGEWAAKGGPEEDLSHEVLSQPHSLA